MWANTLARTINGLNPTSRGRKWLAQQSERFGRPASGACAVIGPMRMQIDAADELERLIYYRAFEREELAAVAVRLRRGDVFLDLGANVGLFTLLARHAVGDAGKVIAVEPNPAVRTRLECNLALNGNLGVTVLPIAASDQAGELDLHVPADGTNHGIASLRPQGTAGGEETIVRVRVERLDDVLPAQLARPDGVRRVNFIKIDIEGAELGALRGMAETIRRDRPRMLIELNYVATRPFGYRASEIARYVLELHPDYRMSRVGTHRVEPIDLATLAADRPFGTDVVNVLFD